MGSKNDICGLCGRTPYYDGHEAWCIAITELEERVEAIEKRIDPQWSVKPGEVRPGEAGSG